MLHLSKDTYLSGRKESDKVQVFYENQSQKIYCRNNKGHILECKQHLHYNIEIAFIYSGSTDVNVDNSPTSTAQGGDVILVFPNQIHAFSTRSPERHVLLLLDPQLFPEHAHLFSEYVPQSSVIKGAANDDELKRLIENISELYNSHDQPYREIALRGYLLAFLSRLFALSQFKKTNSEDIHAIGYVINYCIANYNKNLSLDMLQNDLHISKYYISHIVNQKLGMNFNDYVNSIRISNACRYLTEGKMSVLEISETVGFNTVRTFNRAFVKQIGVSPRTYRNKNTNQALGGEK